MRRRKYRPNRRKNTANTSRNRAFGWRLVIRIGEVAAGGVGITLLSFACIFGHDFFTQSTFFVADKIQIEGRRRLSEQTILSQAGLYAGINILSVNLGLVQKRLTAHPWIENARVQRELPRRLRVIIVEQAPIAIVQMDKSYVLNTAGLLFKTLEKGEDLRLPVVEGLALDDVPDAAGGPWSRNFAAVMQVLQLGQRPDSMVPNDRIETIRVDSRLGLTLATRTRIGQVKLGFDRYPEKYGRLRNVLLYLTQERQVARIDWIDLHSLTRIVVNPAPPDFTARRQKEI